ncbi:hypothetical protein DS831_06415 [Bombilactobacillus bombi]|uniref:DUF4767 domain-containing protein n=1 Tax=Bombilactobacillus bombi TaxID=1303590 RepID=A0A3R6ZX66_9LACO|nr:hypothetical protein [Bombilactobacillus bombi]RHW49794.1 hypothetical protein DS831_06415 [Bombilactobacillus bombi]
MLKKHKLISTFVIGIIVIVIIWLLVYYHNQGSQKSAAFIKSEQVTKKQSLIKHKWDNKIPKSIIGVYKRKAYDGTDLYTDYLIAQKTQISFGGSERTVIKKVQSYQLSKNEYILKGLSFYDTNIDFYIKIKVIGTGKNRKIGIYHNPSNHNPTFEGMKKAKKIDTWYKFTTDKPYQDNEKSQNNNKQQSNANLTKYTINEFVGKIYRLDEGDKSMRFIELQPNYFGFYYVMSGGPSASENGVANPNYQVNDDTLEINGTETYGGQYPVYFKILSLNRIQNRQTGETYVLYNGTEDQLVDYIDRVNNLGKYNPQNQSISDSNEDNDTDANIDSNTDD